MARVTSKPKRVFVFTLMLVMLMTGFGSVGNASATDSANMELPDSMIRTDLSDIKDELSSTSYSDYLTVNSYYTVDENGETVINKDMHATARLDIDLSAYDNDHEDLATVDFFKDASEIEGIVGANGNFSAVAVGDDGSITYTFVVEKTAFYCLEVGYYTGNVYFYPEAECKTDAEGKHYHDYYATAVKDEGYSNSSAKCEECGADLSAISAKNSAIERKILIDGSIPYKESRSVKFQRSWADVYYVGKGDDRKELLSNSPEYIEALKNAHNKGETLFVTDANKNEKKPEKALINEWVATEVYDSTGYASDPLMFYLEAGTHTVTIDAIREPVIFNSLAFVPVKVSKTYEQYLAEHKDAKDVPAGICITLQGEDSCKTSSNTIYQTSDRTSAYTEPQDVACTLLNEIGGDKWQYVGQWIEWQVSVPETGFYNIVPRSIQDFYSGVFVSRKFYIDGEVPFEEAGALRFDYSDVWKTGGLTDGKTNFKFYLEKGTHVIRLEVVLGEMAQILSDVETSLNNINSYYRKILMITGPDPDEYRDYSFERTLPEVVRGLRNEAKILEGIYDALVSAMGPGDHSVTLEKVAYTVKQMGNQPSKIAALMDDLKTQTGSLGTWLTQTQNQPLNIDYIKFMAPSDELPEAEAGFFRELWQEILKFIMSFFTDYTSISSADGKGTSETDQAHTVEVWVTTGRDQASILRNLVDDKFSIMYPGINIKVKLVAAGTLLPSTLAGTGPDVALGNAQTEAINYAIRSAVMALNDTTVYGKDDDVKGYDFNNFDIYKDDPVYKNNGYYTVADDGSLDWNVDTIDEVRTRFANQATVPLTLYGKLYGIPENMSFYMMFYRKDILAELDLTVPNTWDDFYQMIYTLQSNKLEIGFPSGVTGSTIWMYQKGITMYDEGNFDAYKNNKDYWNKLQSSGNTYTHVYYDDEWNKIGEEELPKTNGMTINLDDEVALACFEDVCQLYTMYDFPVTYDFANRFRSGEMPIAIADYTAYNQLIVFAPEINGMWEFTPLPGTVGDDGKINNTTVGTVTTMMMLRSVEERGNEFASYIFMQWWSGADAQSSYGNEMEALLGPSAKQNTANMEALYSMPWTKSEYDNLSAQFNSVTCTPEYPGGYIIARYAQFAFLAVYNEDAEPVEKLQSYITTINAELSRKRQEFGLPIVEDYPLDK
ncbi:MAG: extracellular solute-binding protein [Ruminococcaceae bacterium]|nr:extracellular solute-binding protein [Oscillospiraceae bacterium]